MVLQNPRDPVAVAELRAILAACLDNFLVGRSERSGALRGDLIQASNYWEGQPRDSLGRWVDANGGGLSEHDNIARGQRALTRALNQKADVQNAMYRKEVGAIHFEWGRPGETAKDYAEGYGISHVAAKHPEDLKHLPELLAKGRVIPHDEEPATKRYVIHDGRVAVLSRLNQKNAYVVTGFAGPKTIAKFERGGK